MEKNQYMRGCFQEGYEMLSSYKQFYMPFLLPASFTVCCAPKLILFYLLLSKWHLSCSQEKAMEVSKAG